MKEFRFVGIRITTNEKIESGWLDMKNYTVDQLNYLMNEANKFYKDYYLEYR